MYIRPRFQLLRVLRWTFDIIPAVALWAAALTAAHVLLDLTWLRLPGLPVAVLGTAVAFYLGFKGNAGYERLWEARKIWGGIVNASRTWGVHVTTLITDHHRSEPGDVPLADVHRELIYRHVAWLQALRTQLLRAQPWEHRLPWNDEFRRNFGTLDQSDEVLRERVEPFVSERELGDLMAQKNPATQIVHKQGERLTELYAEGRIDSFRHIELVGDLEEFYSLQGRCERIKNFPLPRQYASANHWFVKIFILLLPLALLDAFRDVAMPEWYTWVTVPVTVIIGWVFYAWDIGLDYSENPFEGLINDIPMHSLSRTIEIDLREMLGETELPPPVAAFDDAVLL